MTTPATETLDPLRTAVLVIDLQEKLLPAIDGHERVLANSLLLLRLAQVIALPVVLTTQYRRGLGETVPAVRELAGRRRARQDLVRLLRGRGVPRPPEVARARPAPGGGHREPHLRDADGPGRARRRDTACTSRPTRSGRGPKRTAQVGLARMERAGALVSSAEMALYELLGRSDGAAFKAMLPHLKG